jgi:hypothetical protein
LGRGEGRQAGGKRPPTPITPCELAVLSVRRTQQNAEYSLVYTVKKYGHKQ